MVPIQAVYVIMQSYRKSLSLVLLFLVSLSVPALSNNVSGQSTSEIEVLHTAVNPYNNKTYHLLSEGSWSDSAEVARALDGFLTTVDDTQENQWIFGTFVLHIGFVIGKVHTHANYL